MVHANRGNQHAVKDPDRGKTDASALLRMHSEDKQRWEKEADKRKLSFNEWAVGVLNKAVKR